MFWPFRRKKQSKHFEALSKKFEERKNKLFEEFNEKHQFAVRWAIKKGVKPEELVQKSARGLAAGLAAGAMILSTTVPFEKREAKEIRREVAGRDIKTTVKPRKDISDEVKKALHGEDMYNERKITKKLSKALKLPVRAELNGIRLNTSYGIMGYESHLSRYPGDNINSHLETAEGFQNFGRASMAGGPGAWGYLASSKEALSSVDIEREKYYLVAQTFLSPSWGPPQVKEWFRHRKMVVVNPANGEVIIGVLEDAGPELSTGRNFGGSPEVMEALGFSGGGSYVLMYFVDDPNDKIPLGPYGL